MSLADKSGWVTVAVLATAGVVSAAGLGMHVPWQEMWSQWMMFGFVGLCAGFFHRRGNERFVTIALALLQFTMFGIAYGVAMYAACALARPLIDEQLMAGDAALGLHLPTIVQWMGTHPTLRRVFGICYDTVLPQTMILIVGGGLMGRSREVHEFLRGLFLCSLVALVVFAIWPAVGPFRAYGYELSAQQQQYVDQFHAIREGRLTEIPWPGAVGLITFPSMHASWALLLIYAVRWSRWLWVPSALLNLVVIASTMTTGWHYFGDVLAGVAVAGAVMAGCRVWESSEMRFASSRRRFGEPEFVQLLVQRHAADA